MPHPHTASAMHDCKTALPVCPACGGLECLCRPRFFCGQVLTDEDLNRLEHYIIEKNKLHNRYIHGWGVACGMEVSCHPCEGFVTVKAGYALSPCGNDIVVCRNEAVNVCELLRKCRDEMRRYWECDPAWPRPEPECEQDQQWVLYICYEEKPSRGITALRGSSAPACCSTCSCGGSSACGCGCHGSHGEQMKSSYRPPQKRAPLPQCEPTITCEGYSFQLRKPPKPVRDLGRMINRLLVCLRELARLQHILNEPGLTPAKVIAVKDELRLILEEHGVTNCELYKKLSFPGVPEIDYLRTVVREAARDCFCSALIPPCPEPVDDDCVPVATITVNCKDGCRIVRICNLENRRIVPTVPSFDYWLESFLRRSELAESIATFCCGVDERHLRPTIDGLLEAVGPPVPPENAPISVFNQLQSLFKSFIKNLI